MQHPHVAEVHVGIWGSQPASWAQDSASGMRLPVGTAAFMQHRNRALNGGLPSLTKLFLANVGAR